jgi:MoaA/NifB/PqqE/SkfB family radical SAM enzyme
MRKIYAETISTCSKCGQDCKGIYHEGDEGIFLETNCPTDGSDIELIEKDGAFFRKAYEYDGYSVLNYLILPVTYRCNLSCRYCYAHSNYKHQLPDDRSIDKLIDIINTSGCTTVNLAGGEPTVREDLPELLTAIKERTGVKRLCVVSNGQKTTSESYLLTLRESGMDFLFLPLFIAGYKPDGVVIQRITQSIENAYHLRIPVWIQASIENLNQLPSVVETINKYHKIIFNITIRSVRPYGITAPEEMVHVSDLLRYFNMEEQYDFGNHPFNRHVKLFGRTTKLSSWVNDRIKLDPYDARYVTYDDQIVPFHKGMIIDDIHFKTHKEHC